MAQNFRVLHKQVGPFPQLTEHGKTFVFSMDQFKALHPCPRDEDPATYHTGLIDRLLQIEAIALTNEPAESVIPIGPHNMKKKPFVPKPRTRAEQAEDESVNSDEEPDPEAAPSRGRPRKEAAST